MSTVGIDANISSLRVWRKPSKSVKKKVWLWTTGPPNTNPYWLRSNSGLTPLDGLKKPTAFSAVFRLNSHAVPEKLLVPLRSDALITAPPVRPYSALKLLVCTLNCSTASGETCTTWFEKPWLLVPYELLSRPSSMKLLTALRRPLTLNDASRESAIADRRTPGLSSARSA